MPRRVFRSSCVAAALVLVLAGCDTRPAEERINLAMPVRNDVMQASAALLSLAAEGKRDTAPLAAEVAARMKLRALECAKGYAPGWFDEDWNIAAALAEQADCFNTRDDELKAWIGERRVAELLLAPPLAPKPATLPLVNVPASAAGFMAHARNAGVMVATHVLSGEYAVMKVESGAVLATGRARFSGALSDNGRLFVTVQRGNDKSATTQIHEAANGAVLRTLPDVAGVHFIGDKGMLIRHQPAGADSYGEAKATFVDLGTGLESPLVLPSRWDVLDMPGDIERVVLTNDAGMLPLALRQTDKGWAAKLGPAYERTGYHVDFSAGVTADGKKYVSALGTNLMILDLDTGKTREVSLAPFVALQMQPTADPDRVLLTGHYGPPIVQEAERLLVSLSRGTAVVVPMAGSDEIVHWVPEYMTVVVARDHMIRPIAIDASGVEMPFDAVVAARMPELQALADAKLEAKRMGNAFDYRGGLPSTTPRAAAPVTLAGPVAELAKKARIVGIGVYEGTRLPGGDRTGTVRVNVMRTKGPIILVLSSYDPVRWVVTADPGAEVGAVLLSGYSRSQVMGVQAPVHTIGTNYTYGDDSGGGSRRGLDADVQRWTGKGFDRFEGKYRGDAFYLRE